MSLYTSFRLLDLCSLLIFGKLAEVENHVDQSPMIRDKQESKKVSKQEPNQGQSQRAQLKK